MIDRFLRHVSPEPMSGCWLWTMATNKGGYGLFGTTNSELAHRFSYRAFVGPIPDGMCVCHTCDVRQCVNPAHLWLGTRADNNKDRSGKMRGCCGERMHTSKLSRDQVNEIRRLLSDGHLSLAAIGRKFGVAFQTVQGIRDGKYWAWLHD